MGGVDVLACNENVRNQLLEMESVRTSLVGQLVWLGFWTRAVQYARAQRVHGKSQWSWSKKTAYFQDSFFSFTDAPIRILLTSGLLGTSISLSLSAVVLGVGDRVTIKSGVQLWNGLRVENDVFIGPNATFTNDPFPRSKQPPERFPTTVL